jgi:hypothetical protein
MARGLHPWDAVIDAMTNRFSADRADRRRRRARHDPDRLGSLLGARWPTRSSAVSSSRPWLTLLFPPAL